MWLHFALVLFLTILVSKPDSLKNYWQLFTVFERNNHGSSTAYYIAST